MLYVVTYFYMYLLTAIFISDIYSQQVNHFPGTFHIGRKDKLWKNFSSFQAVYGDKVFIKLCYLEVMNLMSFFFKKKKNLTSFFPKNKVLNKY